jgi:hypothetical protein
MRSKIFRATLSPSIVPSEDSPWDTLEANGIGMIRRLLFLSSLLSTVLSGQTPAPPALIDQLVANAERYRVTLPSLIADEAIVSEASFMGLLPDKTSALGTFRVLRGEPDQPLQESRQITTLNGKPVQPGAKVRLAFTLFGGFGSFQEMFFTSAHRACFDFSLLEPPAKDGTLRIAVVSRPSAQWPAGCPTTFQGVTGLVRVDPITHQLVHMERTVSSDAHIRGNLAPFASVDLAAAKIGDDTFWLPTVVVGRATRSGIHAQFIAHYSNYHRYTASITLLPGATEVDPAIPPRR